MMATDRDERGAKVEGGRVLPQFLYLGQSKPREGRNFSWNVKSHRTLPATSFTAKSF